MRGGPGVLADLGLDPGDHVCGFYNGTSIRDEVTAAWVTEGVEAGQKCVCFVNESQELVDRLGDQMRERPGGIEFCDADEAYAPGGLFCKDTMLRRLETSVTSAMTEGY